MNKSIKILEALNDINEDLLVYNSEKVEKESFYEILKKRITDMRSLKYVLAPIITLSIVLAGIISFNNMNNKSDLQIAKEDNIVFNNNNNIEKLTDIVGKSIKIDVISKFKFLHNLNIPKEYELEYQYALYEKENLDDAEYTKLWQHEIFYALKDSDNNIIEDINIIFTKQNHILACILPDKNDFPISIINEREVYLLESDQFSAKQAFFEYNGYKFFIESSKLSESEFVDLIKSIIS